MFFLVELRVLRDQNLHDIQKPRNSLKTSGQVQHCGPPAARPVNGSKQVSCIIKSCQKQDRRIVELKTSNRGNPEKSLWVQLNALSLRRWYWYILKQIERVRSLPIILCLQSVHTRSYSSSMSWKFIFTLFSDQLCSASLLYFRFIVEKEKKTFDSRSTAWTVSANPCTTPYPLLPAGEDMSKTRFTSRLHHASVKESTSAVQSEPRFQLLSKFSVVGIVGTYILMKLCQFLS